MPAWHILGAKYKLQLVPRWLLADSRPGGFLAKHSANLQGQFSSDPESYPCFFYSLAVGNGRILGSLPREQMQEPLPALATARALLERKRSFSSVSF